MPEARTAACAQLPGFPGDSCGGGAISLQPTFCPLRKLVVDPSGSWLAWQKERKERGAQSQLPGAPLGAWGALRPEPGPPLHSQQVPCGCRELTLPVSHCTHCF